MDRLLAPHQSILTSLLIVRLGRHDSRQRLDGRTDSRRLKTAHVVLGLAERVVERGHVAAADGVAVPDVGAVRGLCVGGSVLVG